MKLFIRTQTFRGIKSKPTFLLNILTLVVFLSSCSIVEDDFQDLKVTASNEPIFYPIDGIANFILTKKSIKLQNDENNLVDTSQLLLTIENLTSEDLQNLNFWIIGYNTVGKRNEDINFIYKKNIPVINSNISLGEIGTTYKTLDSSLTYRFFDIEIGSVDGVLGLPTSGIYSAAISFFKNDTIEVGATTGICQINYLGDLKLKPDNESVFSEITGIVTGSGKFFGEVQSPQGVFPIVNSDTALFIKNENLLTAIIHPEEFLLDSITRIDLNLTSYQSVNQ